MSKISKRRLEEILSNLFEWGLNHDDEFMKCMIAASHLTLEESKDLEVEEYHEDYEQEDEEEGEDDPYEKTGYESDAESLLMDIAEALDMPYEDDDPASYDEWNYVSLLHDYNNGRGDEWVSTFEEEGLDSKLLEQYKKLIHYEEDEDDEEEEDD